jgi:predicted ATPase/class 3 adenylate cyclase/DNA-binding CsgD family transcriptional regulator
MDALGLGSGSPVGVVTFLLTDVVASTGLWQRSPLAGKVLTRQTELIAGAVADHGGVRPPDQGEGDSTLSVFARPGAALAAALAAQRALLSEPWPDGASVSVRMAVQTGEAERAANGNYGGLALIRAARLRGLARGGQVLVSGVTAGLVADSLPEAASLAELGDAVLPGFERPERVHQLCHPALPVQPRRLDVVRTPLAGALSSWATSLVGRARERREVGELLAKGRLVTITGAGGSGKTRLAHAVAQDRIDQHADGVVWVELARVSDGAQVASAVVSACGLIETAGASALDVLTHRLAKTNVLIVLDNCEHLLAPCAELADALLRAGPEVRLLATAREPLGVAGETMWRIPSLSVPAEDERSLERIAAAEAVQLFVQRARASQPDFELDAEDAALVAAICRRLDGIPLALELAAARVRALSLERLATGLDDRFRLLTGGARTAMARQRTLLASVEWSYDLLDLREQALFRRLAVFASPFSLEAAETVAAAEDLDRFDVFELLAHLVDKSLVVREGERYRMLETLRHFALERASDEVELEQLRDRHLAWFRRRAASWDAQHEVLTERTGAEITAESPDLIAAIDWGLGRDRAAAIELLQALGSMWVRRLALAEARAVSARALRGLEVGSPLWLETLAPVVDGLMIAGDFSWLPAVRSALDERRDSIAPLARVQLEHAASWAHGLFRPGEAVEGLTRAIEDARNSGSRAREIIATATLALVSIYSDARRALRLAEWADRQCADDSVLLFLVRQAHAVAALMAGDVAAARALTLRHHPTAAFQLYRLALATGERALLREALDLLDHYGDLGVLDGIREMVQGGIAVLDGDFETARERFRSPRGTRGNRAALELAAIAHLAAIAGALDDETESQALLAELEREASDAGSNVDLAFADVLRGYWARKRSPSEAESAAHRGIARMVEFGFMLPLPRALKFLAVIVGESGRLAEAGRLIGAAEGFRAQRGLREVYPLPPLDALRTRIDPAAIEEGSRLSLEEAVEYARRGRGERTRPDHGWESLTPTEARVVELVAEGLPNKEIAAKLFVSLATVKTHLVHVYTKLDVRTRTELAAEATRRARAAST